MRRVLLGCDLLKVAVGRFNFIDNDPIVILKNPIDPPGDVQDDRFCFRDMTDGHLRCIVLRSCTLYRLMTMDTFDRAVWTHETERYVA